ncbi:MAG: PqqD family protein [Bacteroidota bacterium]
MKKQVTLEMNLWELMPLRLAKWETTEEGKVVVLVPKFKHPLLVKWVMPVLAKPYFRIKLDDIGSTIWMQCDGKTPVSAIAGALKSKFGEAVEPVEARIHSFLNHLDRGDLLQLEHAGIEHGVHQ